MNTELSLPPNYQHGSIVSKLAKLLTKDPRHYQVLFLMLFLLFGIMSLGWNIELPKFLLTFATCITTQFLFTSITSKDYSSLKSALISSLSLCLMFKANATLTVGLAAMLSISSKFILRYNGKHVFNPTNFGIIVTILLTHDAWISPGQWGSNALLLFIIGLLGLSVLMRVKRLDTALAFFITFCGLSYCRLVLYQGWPIDFFFHQLSSGTLLLFTFFMITDPVSTPSHKVARIVWAMLVGILAFWLQFKMFVNGAPVWALFFLSPLTLLFDKLFVAGKFQWLSNTTRMDILKTTSK